MTGFPFSVKSEYERSLRKDILVALRFPSSAFRQSEERSGIGTPRSKAEVGAEPDGLDLTGIELTIRRIPLKILD